MPEARAPSSRSPARILIVDDHPIVRTGLASLISQQPDLTVCGQADGIAEALELIANESPDLAVVDISLKHGNGLDLIKQIAVRAPSVRVLVSSMHDETLYAERSLNAGALGYINKEQAARDVVTAIRTVLTGKIYLSPRMSEQLLGRLVGAERSTPKRSVESLSDRELEVFRLIGGGLTTRQIAERLNISPKTVETYRQRIKHKLRIENAAQLASRAAQWVGGADG